MLLEGWVVEGPSSSKAHIRIDFGEVELPTIKGCLGIGYSGRSQQYGQWNTALFYTHW